MVIVKRNPVAEDVPIQALQVALHDYILARWNIPSAQYNCYGRAYRNYSEGGYLPEVFIGGSNGKEYKDAFHNDVVTATSFFGITNSRSTFDGQQNILNAHLIFSVNIEAIKPGSRYDAEARADVQYFLEEYLLGGTPIERVTDIDRVYAEYSAWRASDNMKLSDMHPYHCFRFNFDLLPYETLECQKPLISKIFNN